MVNAHSNKVVPCISGVSNPFEIFFTNICVTLITIATNMIKISTENTSVDDVMMKNQNDNPAVTARDLNLGDDAFILNRIDKCH